MQRDEWEIGDGIREMESGLVYWIIFMVRIQFFFLNSFVIVYMLGNEFFFGRFFYRVESFMKILYI